MPRFFFHVRDGQDFTDEDGTELASLAVARREAVTYAGQLLQEKPDDFWSDRELSMVVTNEAGLRLFALTFLAMPAPATAMAAAFERRVPVS